MSFDGGTRSEAPEHRFRGDIEGMRGIAVLLVVFFHASIRGFSGGFVGVDVFFVLSGFLITGLLIREIESTGTISLSNFYARRARRLLPAAGLVLAVTMVASIILLPPLLIPNIAADVAAAALYVSNMRFAFQATDYFAAASSPSPILHFWSLGVEEQFYVFWPAIVLLIARGAKKPTRRIGIAVVTLALASFASAVVLLTVSRPWAFFSLPTRAWELALGGILAVAGKNLGRMNKHFASFLTWLGLALVVLSGVLLNEKAAFPGVPALAPTIGVALVIIGGSRKSLSAPSRILGTALPRFFGRISYSLYLWHWPILVLPLAVSITPLPLTERIGLVVFTIALATVTQKWVEDPLRHGRLVGTKPRRNLVTAGALAIIIAAVSLGVGAYATSGLQGANKTNAKATAESLKNLDSVLNADRPVATATSTGTPQPFVRPGSPDGPVPKDLQPGLGWAKTDRALPYLDRCHTQQDLPASNASCLYANVGAATTIVLFGDSHALSWFPAVNRAAKAMGLRLLSLTMSACSPADIPAWNPTYDRVMRNCTYWRTDSIKRIIGIYPDIVLVAGTRGFATVDKKGNVLSGAARFTAWHDGMIRTLNRLKAGASHVILIADTPAAGVDPPVCLSAHPKSILACSTPVENAIQDDWQREERGVADEEKIPMIDASLWVCPTSPCPVVIGNLLIYSDAGHLTATFSAALSHRMKSAISAIVPEPVPSPIPTK